MRWQSLLVGVTHTLRLSHRSVFVRGSKADFSRNFCASSSADKEELIMRAKELLVQAQAVCFDVDSTVINEEGIDVLASHMGAGDAVAELTANAMGGTMKFEDALADRLALIKPTNQDIIDCLEKHPLELTKGVKELVMLLHERDVKVFLVSGGFRSMIYPVAEELGIPAHRVYANTIIYGEDGQYKTFDDEEPTCRDGGKAVVIQRLKDDHGYSPVIMVGDGATDLQSRPPADAFIGFGGVAQRQVVEEEADWFVTNFEDVSAVLRNAM